MKRQMIETPINPRDASLRNPNKLARDSAIGGSGGPLVSNPQDRPNKLRRFENPMFDPIHVADLASELDNFAPGADSIGKGECG